MKYRVQCSRWIREYIVIDVVAENPEEVKAAKDSIHAEICGLPGWRDDYDAGANFEDIRFDETIDPDGLFMGTPIPAEQFSDTAARATLAVHSGEAELLEAERPMPSVKRTIEIVLEKHSASCLDNEEERTKILTDLVAALEP